LKANVRVGSSSSMKVVLKREVKRIRSSNSRRSAKPVPSKPKNKPAHAAMSEPFLAVVTNLSGT